MTQTQPIFVGGTRRSGSTVVGYLLGAHPQVWCTLPRELRFLTDPDGLLDLVLGRDGRLHPALDLDGPGSSGLKARVRQLRGRGDDRRPTSPSDFERGMYGLWWNRLSPDGEPRGLHRGIPEQRLRSAMQRFDENLGSSPVPAARDLVHDLLDTSALDQGAQMWADTTPQNAENAHRLIRLFPEAKVIFMIRDGRDTVASVLQKPWGPDDPMIGLEWWRTGARRATLSMEQLSQRQGLTLRLGRLINTDREESLERLFGFLELPVTDSVRRFFEERMSARAGHVDRWKRDIPERILPAFEARYGEIWEELTELGLDLPEPTPLRKLSLG